MTLEELAGMLEETGFPFAYDHFAEGESPDPPFICYLLPGSDNFSADGRVTCLFMNVNTATKQTMVAEDFISGMQCKIYSF